MLDYIFLRVALPSIQVISVVHFINYNQQSIFFLVDWFFSSKSKYGKGHTPADVNNVDMHAFLLGTDIHVLRTEIY